MSQEVKVLKVSFIDLIQVVDFLVNNQVISSRSHGGLPNTTVPSSQLETYNPHGKDITFVAEPFPGKPISLMCLPVAMSQILITPVSLLQGRLFKTVPKIAP